MLKNTYKTRLGQQGETLAARYCQTRRGLSIIGCNLRTRYFEADLIAEDHENRQAVIIEVKTTNRKSTGAQQMGRGYESITYRKQLKLKQAAAFCLQNKLTQYPDIRVDLIVMQKDYDGLFWVEHIVDIL